MVAGNTNNAPLLKDLIEIPTRDEAHGGDFVLKLTEGIDRRQQTLDSYVVTPQLARAFGEAVALINASLSRDSSEANYLHGSFGSGKSHFMAVLHGLLDPDYPDARRLPEFHELVTRHPWLGQRKLLTVGLHLIGSENMEAAVLGGYVTHIRRHHPDAPLPAVYRVQGLLDDIRALRDRLGTETFLAGLGDRSTAAESAQGWGTMARSSQWTADKLNAVLTDPFEPLKFDQKQELQREGHYELTVEAQELLTDAITAYLPNYVDAVTGSANVFIPLDAGLSVISRHAKSLGFDGIVLFLDELVLWLAGKIGNQGFISTETEKVSKLVEATDSHRAVPIISFIARQRDLRDLGVGAERTGAETQALHDNLSHWDGRIGRIDLEDRNLPLIAERRVLKPRDEQAQQQVGAVVHQRIGAMSPVVRDVLLDTHNADSFARTYPFSPAFMDTLVKLSAALQRERTALLLMRQILVDRREDLRLGQLVPLGDLYTAIADGADQPFTTKLKDEFEKAGKLYANTLRPMLLAENNLTEESLLGSDGTEPAVRTFRSDDRLLKTLLLSALAPEVSALRELTARRLTALNHGVITSPIAGQETALVVGRLRRWASQVPMLQIGEGSDPTLGLNLVGVDIDVILNRVRHFDDAGARRTLLRELLFQELHIDLDDGTPPIPHKVAWRGSRRVLEIRYGNVRDRETLRDESLVPGSPDRWLLVIDFPFDGNEHPAIEDVNRLLDLRREHGSRQVVAWLPAFFTEDVLKRVGRLVQVNYLLTGNRLDEHARHLGAADRQRARDLLGNLRTSLTSDLKDALRHAYGLMASPKEEIVQHWQHHFVSLSDQVEPKPEPGRRFDEALASLVDQLHNAVYPTHPDFDPQRKGDVVRDADLRITLRYVQAAAEAEGGRLDSTERADRDALRRIVHPLRLGEELNGPFLLDNRWETDLERRAAKELGSDADIPIAALRSWLRPHGLETRVENLVIAAFAASSRRGWVRDNAVAEAPSTPEEVVTFTALRRYPLPDEQQWALACARAETFAGQQLHRAVISPSAVGRFTRVLKAKLRVLVTPAVELVEALDRHAKTLGLERTATTGRLATARIARDLLTTLNGISDPTRFVIAWAEADLGKSTPLHLSKSCETAIDVAEAVRTAQWTVLDQLAITGTDDPKLDELRATLHRQAFADEQEAGLRQTLRQVIDEYLRLTVERAKKREDERPANPGPAGTPTPDDSRPETDPPTDSPTQGGQQPVKRRHHTRQATGELSAVIAELRGFAAEHPGALIEVEYRVVDGTDGDR